jgi:hypothetical protein
MKQLTAGQVALRLLEGVLTAFGWVLSALGGVLNAAAAPRSHASMPPKPTEIDQDGHIVKEGTTDFP